MYSWQIGLKETNQHTDDKNESTQSEVTKNDERTNRCH